MTKLFILSEDVYRWRLVEINGENRVELEHSEGTWTERDEAMDSIEQARKDHPDAGFAEENTITERVVYATPLGENADAAYQRGREDAKREMREQLG